MINQEKQPVWPSVVDCFIVSNKLFPFVSHNEVGNRTEKEYFPLHCTFSFNCTAQTEVINSCDNLDKPYVKNTWKEDCKDIFIENFNLLFHDMKDDILSMMNMNIDTCVNKVVQLYQTTAECLKSRTTRRTNLMHKRWWDDTCEQLTKAKFKAFRVFRWSINE